MNTSANDPVKTAMQHDLAEHFDCYFLIAKVSGEPRYIALQKIENNSQKAAAIVSLSTALDQLQVESHWN